MKLTKTYNYFPVCVPKLLSRPLRCSLGLSFVLYSLLFSAALLTGCSEDSEWTGRVVDNVEVQFCATGYEEEGDMSRMDDAEPWGVTRSWAPPTSPDKYVLYSKIYGTNGMFADQKDLVNKSISAFFTQDDETPVNATFFFRDSDNTWHMKTGDDDGLAVGDYYLYGFIPKEDAVSATIESYDGTSANGNNSYSEGAKLTIRGLNTVTPSDVCVIVGAKDDKNFVENNDPYTVSGLQAGHFDVHFYDGGDNENVTDKNYIFLLFDHIYSAVRFRFKLDETYAALRTIRLRKLDLVAYSNDHGGAVKAKYNATITLRKNDSGTSPIVDVEFTPDNSSADVNPVLLYDWDNDPAKYVTLTTSEPQQFMGCFVPGDHTYFKLLTTYDVFDKKDNLIRQQCQAENTFDLRSKFDSYMETVRGHRYSYTITVQPTYLYVLSEPDLDNPTMTIEN